MNHNADEGFSEGLWLNKLPLYAPRICYLRHSDYSFDHPVENAVHHLDENTYVSDGFFPYTSDIQYVLRKEVFHTPLHAVPAGGDGGTVLDNKHRTVNKGPDSSESKKTPSKWFRSIVTSVPYIRW